MAYVITIAGSPVDLQPGWSTHAVANLPDTAIGRVQSMDGMYRPGLDDEIVMTEDGTRIFGGFVTRPSEAGLGGYGVTPIDVQVNANDYNICADRIFVSVVIPPGTLKAALTVLVAKLNPTHGGYGIALHGSQVDGPDLPGLTYDYVKLSDIFANLTTLTEGYVWEIDYDKNLRMFAPGSQAAPINIATGDGNTVGDITVELSRDGYANRVIATSSSAFSYVIGESHAGNGSAQDFQLSKVSAALDDTTLRTITISGSGTFFLAYAGQLTYDIAVAGVTAADIETALMALTNVAPLTPVVTGPTGGPFTLAFTTANTPVVFLGGSDPAVVAIASGAVVVYGASGPSAGPVGIFPAGTYGRDDMPWTFEQDTNTVHQRVGETVVPSGGSIQVSYTVTLTAVAEDTGEQDANGMFQAVISVDAANPTTLASFATTYLAAHLSTKKVITYYTYAKGLKPGQTQTIDVPERNINNTCFITDIVSTAEATLVKRRVQATEGAEFLSGSGWRDTYQRWSGAASASSVNPASSSSGGGSGGGGSIRTPAAYFMGGSVLESVTSPTTPAWVQSSEIQVVLDTVRRGSNTVTVTCRVRCDSGNVTVRLRNISDNVTAGTSAVVASTTWLTVTFSATLTPGSKIYRLEGLPSLADVAFQVIGYLE